MRGPNSVVAFFFVVAGVLWSCLAVAADECGDPTFPWIRLDFGVEPLRDLSVSEVTAQLRAGLASRGIDVCLGMRPDRAAPVATLVVSPSDNGGVALTLEVRDAITAKRVGRDVDLRLTPPDGRALAVAVEADELLRATWAELAMKDAPAPRMVVPRAVRSSVASSIAPTSDERGNGSRGAIALRGSVERFTGGLSFLGGDLRSEYWFASLWAATLSIGYRVAPSFDSPLGQVSANAMHGGTGAAFAITPRGRAAGVNLSVSLDALLVHFEPLARADAIATPANDWAVVATATLGGWVAIGSPLRFCWGAGVALPIRAVETTSDAQPIESTKGVGLVGDIGVEFSFGL